MNKKIALIAGGILVVVLVVAAATMQKSGKNLTGFLDFGSYFSDYRTTDDTSVSDVALDTGAGTVAKPPEDLVYTGSKLEPGSFRVTPSPTINRSEMIESKSYVTIDFNLLKSSKIKLGTYSNGQFFDGVHKTGHGRFFWDVTDPKTVPAGIRVVTLEIFSDTGKLEEDYKQTINLVDDTTPPTLSRSDRDVMTIIASEVDSPRIALDDDTPQGASTGGIGKQVLNFNISANPTLVSSKKMELTSIRLKAEKDGVTVKDVAIFRNDGDDKYKIATCSAYSSYSDKKDEEGFECNFKSYKDAYIAQGTTRHYTVRADISAKIAGTLRFYIPEIDGYGILWRDSASNLKFGIEQPGPKDLKPATVMTFSAGGGAF